MTSARVCCRLPVRNLQLVTLSPQKDEFDGTVVKAHGEDSKAPVPVKSGKVAPADVAGPAKPRVSTREDGVDKGTEKGVRWN